MPREGGVTLGLQDENYARRALLLTTGSNRYLLGVQAPT
jgi:hypothetical protein